MYWKKQIRTVANEGTIDYPHGVSYADIVLDEEA